MKTLICILASATLFGACEQKTDVVAPAASPVPEKKIDPNTFSRTKKPSLSSETKTETTTETTTTASPTP